MIRNGNKNISQGVVMDTGVRNEILEIFENNRRIFLRELVSEKGAAHTTVWNT